MSYPDRRPIADSWLQGAAAVVVLAFDVDAESPILAENERYAEDLSAMSHQAYGPRVGIPRILDLFGSHGIEGTFFVPGVTAERWPETVQAIVRAGHEAALHGRSHRVLPSMAAWPRTSSAGAWSGTCGPWPTSASSPAGPVTPHTYLR